MHTKSIALVLCLSLASCHEDLTTQTQEQPRQFTPRLLTVPTANRVLVEVYTQTTSGVANMNIVAQAEANWFDHSMKLGNLPQGSLWFRISGLDAYRTPLWSASSAIPEGASSSVDIGGTTGIPTQSAPTVGITATASGERLQLSCSALPGYHPVWTQGSQVPTPGSSYLSSMNPTAEAMLPANGKIVARCTNDYMWGADQTWNWEPIPDPTDPDLSSSGTDLGAITINAPIGIAGYVSFTANNLRTDVPNLQMAVRMGGTGEFRRYATTQTFAVDAATKVEAYLLGWSAVSHKWLKGTLQSSVAGKPDLKTFGTSFDAPGIQGPSQLGGNIYFSPPSNLNNYQNLRLAVWTSETQTTTLQDFSYNIVANNAMTVKAYTIAWNPTAGDWFYGKESTLVVPVQSPTMPIASNPADELPAPVPTIPATGSGYASFTVPASVLAELNPVKLAVKNSTGGWDWYETNYQMPVSPGSIIQVYLIGWSSTEKRWKQGSLLEKTVAATTPTAPPSLNLAGTDFGVPAIYATGSFPITVSFSPPNDLSANLSTRQIAYRTAAIGVAPSGIFTYLADGATLPVTGQIELEACMVAWNPQSASWKVGRSKTISITGGLPFGDPILTAAGGTDIDLPDLSIPATLPDYLQIWTPATLSADVIDPKIAFQTSATPTWQKLKSGDKIWIPSATQVTAYVVGWSYSQQKWIYGKPKNFYLDPAGATLSPPGFTDVSGNALLGNLEVPGMSFTINLRASAGTILFTTDGTTPMPSGPTTKTWSSGTILAIPNGQDSVLIRAVTYDGTRISGENKLVVHIPRWSLLDSRDLGCIVQGPDGRVFACGNGSGPKLLQDTGWMDVVPSWNLPAAQTLHANDSELVAGVEGEVWRIKKFATFAERIGTIDLGWVFGLSRFAGGLWASSDSGTVVYYNDAWRHMATTMEPSGTGPMWSDGTDLWQGSGDVVVKFGWNSIAGANDWMDWGTKASNIRAFAADSFSTLRDGIIVATENGIYQWSKTTPSMIGRSIIQSDVRGIEGITWGPGNRLYVAFKDGNGNGGVRRSPGWVSSWNPVALGWPGSAEGSPYGATGVGIQRMNDGTQRVVASTPWGSYAVKLVGF